MQVTYYFDILPLIHLPRKASNFFTYSSESTLPIGSIVSISFHSRRVRGIVWIRLTKKPKYSTKKILSIITERSYFSADELYLMKVLSDFYVTHLSEIARLYIADRTPHKTLSEATRKSFQKDSSKDVTSKIIIINSLYDDLKIIVPQITKTLKSGKQILFLTPTMAQLRGMQKELQGFFPKEEIFVLHSSLSSKDRSTAFIELTTKSPLICISLRHGIFAPMLKTGLIIHYDSNHDAYKQWDLHPKYNVSEIITLKKCKNVVRYVHFPSVNDWECIKSKKYILHKPPNWKSLSKIHFMKKSSAPSGFHPINQQVQKKYKETVSKKRWLFYLNRKGSHRSITCNDCDWSARCEKCQLLLIQKNSTTLKCNRCDQVYPLPLTCINCRGTNLKRLGVGIEKLLEYIKLLSRKTSPIIFDYESSSYSNFNAAATLLMTSTLSSMPVYKNFDYVVMVNADAEYSQSVWNAEEQFIETVWRLAAHTKNDGTLFIQTKNGEELSRLFSETTFMADLQNTNKLRKTLYYPPSGEIILLTKKLKKDENIVELHKLKEYLTSYKKCRFNAQLYTDNRGRWQRIIIRTSLPAATLKENLYTLVPSDWQVEINPITL